MACEIFICNTVEWQEPKEFYFIPTFHTSWDNDESGLVGITFFFGWLNWLFGIGFERE